MVGLSTLLHYLAARRLSGIWILPDEGVYAERALAFWHHGSLPILSGQGAGYSALYPILAGIPLSVGHFATGYSSLKLLQALVVSLAAVPVFVYGRRLMSPGYALVGAVLTVASPLLLYSGLIMTEVLFYPLAAWTLLAIARAVASARRRDVAVALVLIVASILTRTQAVVFLPVLGVAILCDAVFSRTTARIRAFWPVWALLVVSGVVVVARPSTFGSYAGTISGGYPFSQAVGLTLEHLAFAVLSTAVVPAAALAVLAVEAVRGRIRSADIRSLLATAVAALVLVPLQVGFFAARFSPHLLERDLAALPPVLFTVFALWLARGAPRPLVSTAVTGLVVAALLLLTPWNHLVRLEALPDSFSLDPLYRLRHHNPANLVAIVVPLLLVAFAALPRKLTPALAAGALAFLAVSSAVASNTITSLDRADQRNIVGTPRNWIDLNADGNVGYFYDGETYWNTVWQERFWNHRITQVVSTTAAPVPGPMPQTVADLGPSGLLPFKTRWVVASDPHHFAGTAVAHLTQTDLDVSGLTLWRLDAGPPRLSFRTDGVQANGDMVTPANIFVYDCGGGRLQLTLLSKATKRLRILLDGKVVVDANIAGQGVWRGFIPAPRSQTPRICDYEIVPQGLLGSTVIDFLRP